MSNYVENKVLCTKEILNKYFIDYYPFGKDEKIDNPYISFNKIAGVDSLNDYEKKYVTNIYYGGGFEYKKLKDNRYEIKFLTESYYPIYAIIKVIEEFKNDVVWYAAEENFIYLSKFSWNDKCVIEQVLPLENTEYESWIEKFEKSDEGNKIENPDGDIWHYNFEDRADWIEWSYKDLFKRYFSKYPAKEYYTEIYNAKS